MAAIMMDELLGFAAHPLFLEPFSRRPQPCAFSTPSVTEAAHGWDVRLPTPGLSHADVSVQVVEGRDGQRSLRLQGPEGSFRHVVRLPPKADAARVSAIVTHGLLRVSVPRAQPLKHQIQVLPAEPKPSEGEAAGAEHQDEATVTMAVPGVSHDEVKVSVEDDLLTLSAESTHGYGKFVEKYRLPPRTAVGSIRAVCQHGVVTVRVPVTLEARHKISVGSEVPAITAAAPGSPSHSGTDTKKEQQEIALVQVAVPGFSPSDFTAEVVGRALHIHGVRKDKDGNSTCRRSVRRSVVLPAGAPAEAVRVACANGLLRAWMPREALPPAETVTVVAVAAGPALGSGGTTSGAVAAEDEQQKQAAPTTPPAPEEKLQNDSSA